MALFVTSPGTEQGKSYVTRLLCYQHDGAYAIKPVISGYKAEDGSTDTALICQAGERGLTHEQCSPWRFKAPLSPDYAAQLQDETIDFSALKAFCTRDEVEIIEGVGGLMSPLTKQQTNLDLIDAIEPDTLLVSSLYLGCISHILTAIAVMNERNCSLIGLVLTACKEENMPPEVILESLTPHLDADIPIYVLDYVENLQLNWKSHPQLPKLRTTK